MDTLRHPTHTRTHTQSHTRAFINITTSHTHTHTFSRSISSREAVCSCLQLISLLEFTGRGCSVILYYVTKPNVCACLHLELRSITYVLYHYITNSHHTTYTYMSNIIRSPKQMSCCITHIVSSLLTSSGEALGQEDEVGLLHCM